MRLLNILLLVQLALACKAVQNLTPHEVLLLSHLYPFLTRLTSFSLHWALELIWALLAACGLFRGITFKENIL